MPVWAGVGSQVAQLVLLLVGLVGLERHNRQGQHDHLVYLSPLEQLERGLERGWGRVSLGLVAYQARHQNQSLSECSE